MIRRILKDTIATILYIAILTLIVPLTVHAGVFTPEDALKLKRCLYAAISPDGEWIAYTVWIQREPGDEAGPAYNELHLVSTGPGEIRPYITGKVNVSTPRFSPDGTRIAFLMKRGNDAKTQVWMMPVHGGESVQVTSSETSVRTFRWHPAGNRIAYAATTPESKREKELDDKGYGFIYFEENLKARNLYMIHVGNDGGVGEAEQITEDGTVWDFEFDRHGTRIAAAISQKNLVDHNYMFKKIHIIDIDTGERFELTDNPGKLGNFAFNRDGSMLAYAAAKAREDHAVSQALVIDIGKRTVRNVTEPDFRGHVMAVGWKDNKTVAYTAAEGVWNTLNTVEAAGGGKREILLHGEELGFVFYTPAFTEDFKHFAMIGTAHDMPYDIFYWKRGSKEPRRLTHINPWVAERDLGEQEVIRYTARDGLEIEGLLVRPVNYKPGRSYPLIVAVHGGPESHYSKRWLTGYFNPAQVLAGKGYVVFYPNYRASTGYGLDFAMQGYMDAAGREFDDVADGIECLIDRGIADPSRVGLGGGSYGGFAAAWFAGYYTDMVKAVCMFVGISDLLSKRGTTDIPYEELYVHSGKKLEEMWNFSLERSPIYYAHKSKTAVLILGGTADSRVHPSQSLEFYRRLKMNNHPAVRLVKYPGEGHGNARQPGRIDVLYRHLQWYDWYVRDGKPLEGPMPPLDISDDYGLELEKEE
jgi:dipeptidyl aminopeptidase/acylaminoacyl peptidase